MDIEELAPESEEKFEQRQQELLQDAREEKENLEAKQNEALVEIAKGEELKQYTTVELGNLEIEVKKWIPGDTTDTVHKAMEMAESNNPAKMRKSMETMLDALADMTVDDTYGIEFWRAYYEEYGPSGMQPAVNTILSPALEELEEMQQREVSEDKINAVEGFRQDETGSIVRSGDGNDG